MERIKNVTVTRETTHGELFVTRGSILNHKIAGGKSEFVILLENSIMEDITLSAKSGIETIAKNPLTALGAAVITLGKSIAGAIIQNPHAARRVQNGMLDNLSYEYSKIRKDNTPESTVIWKKEFNDVTNMQLYYDGTVKVFAVDGSVFVLHFSRFKKAKEWFEDAENISGMKRA